jgi:hypothetical protein
VSVDNSDMGKMLPMNDALAGQYGTRPRQHLADGGFAKLDDIEALAQERRRDRLTHNMVATGPTVSPSASAVLRLAILS